MTQKVANMSKGVKLPVVQNRLPNASRKPGLWMNPAREYKIAFDGQRFQKYGFMVRKTVSAQLLEPFKVDEKKRALRAKVQRLRRSRFEPISLMSSEWHCS